MNRLLTIAVSLLLAAPVQAARTFYQCTMASARGVETMSIDPEAASATHQGKPADLHGYDWGNAVTQLYEFGGLMPEDRINFTQTAWTSRSLSLPPRLMVRACLWSLTASA